MPKRRPTIQDIAKEADVGIGTVSRVLNAHPNVSDRTREQVRAVIDRLGYHPRSAAREIRTQRSDLVGLLADSVATTPFASALVKGAQDAARERGRLLLLIDSDGNDTDRERAVVRLRERSVEGVLYAALFHHAVTPPPGLRALPTVLVNCFAPGGDLPAVVPDEEQGGYEATRHLLELGHHRVAMITNDAFATRFPAVVGRHRGYRRALAEAGVPYDPALVREGAGDAASGRALGLELLRLPDPPSALFCATDRTAMGVYEAIRGFGLRIPGDVSVVGFDDQPYVADSLYPPLTTMALPHAEMGRWAVVRLLDRSPDGPDPVQVRLRCPPVLRASTAPVPEGR